VHDLDTGLPVGGVVQGTDTMTDIRPHLAAMQAGRRYVQVHTHPRSSALSAQDAILFGSYPALGVSVVGLDGTWYVLSKPAGAALVPALVGQRYRQEVAARTPAYQARVQAGELDPQAAWRDHTHQAWLATAPQVGLRYDRVEPTMARS
jgi:hypothetical protein